MARQKRRLADAQGEFPRAAGGGRRQLRAGMRGGLDFLEQVSAVCKFFCKGHTAAEIRDHMKARGIVMTREEPYRMISYAATHGWIRYFAPLENALRQGLKEKYAWLRDIEVVHTTTSDDVAQAAAKMLLGMLKQFKREGRDEVHIGFAGGHSMRKTAQAFALFLREPGEGALPAKVVFHAMVAGFDVNDPTTSPSAFFTYFVKDAALQVETEFVALNAPAVVTDALLEKLRKMEGIAECFEEAHKLDIIATSASPWDDEDNLLRKYMTKYGHGTLPEALRTDCVGDMLWRPLGRRGPIQAPAPVRALTLTELDELPALIRSNRHVLLVLGPCGACNQLKTKMLETLLNMDLPLLSHLVADSRTVRGMFRPA